MNKIADISEPANELEHLIADLSEAGPLIFVFGVGWWTAHLAGTTAPVFRGPADRRWWHVDLGNDTANWTMDVVDEITGAARARPYPSVLPGGRSDGAVPGARRDTVLSCSWASCMTASR